MNETLEAMARAIFQSWFVDFDPVQAKAEGRDTGLPKEIADLFPDGFEEVDGREVPRGWGVGKITDLGEIICGKTPPTKNLENYGNDMLFITIPDMHNQIFILNASKMLSNTGVQTQSNKTLPPMSICVSCIASPGLVSLTSKPSQTNQQINSIIPLNKKNAFYCYYTLIGLADEIKSSGSGGSVINNLNKGEFSSISVLLPPERIIEKYHDQVVSLFMKILINQEEILTLSQIRDALLPKLMNGEIRVEAE
jgi:type I restriction enzyme S subunit